VRLCGLLDHAKSNHDGRGRGVDPYEMPGYSPDWTLIIKSKNYGLLFINFIHYIHGLNPIHRETKINK